jgi:hypothetical protein
METPPQEVLYLLNPGNSVGSKCDQILPPYPITSTATDILAVYHHSERQEVAGLTETSNYEWNEVIRTKSSQENYVGDASTNK